MEKLPTYQSPHCEIIVLNLETAILAPSAGEISSSGATLDTAGREDQTYIW